MCLLAMSMSSLEKCSCLLPISSLDYLFFVFVLFCFLVFFFVFFFWRADVEFDKFFIDFGYLKFYFLVTISNCMRCNLT